MKLSDDQIKAVEYIESPLLIVAGPGAGKTRVLVEKIIFLIKQKNINPNKIFVSTFTIKAAEELRIRLRDYVGDEVENMQISTFHSFCQTMLEEYSDYHDFGTSFSVLDEEEQYALISAQKNYAYKYRLKDFIEPFEVLNLIDTFNKITENNIDPYNLINTIEAEEKSDDKERRIAIANAYDLYISHLKDLQVMDFACLQKEFLHMIDSNEDILNEIRDRFDYFLIDEYQDTNPIQNKIVKLLAYPKYNITCVGDEDQSIYGFRGASIDNFRNFSNDFPKGKEVYLKKNYRSVSEIIEISDKFIKPNRTYQKELLPERSNFSKPLLIKGTSLEDEAEKAVKFIKSLKENNKIKHYGDVAILFRSVRNHSQEYVNLLKEFKIPYEIKGDGSLLAQQEIISLIYLMSYIKGFQPSEKLQEVWNGMNFWSLFDEVLNLDSDSVENKKKEIWQKQLL